MIQKMECIWFSLNVRGEEFKNMMNEYQEELKVIRKLDF